MFEFSLRPAAIGLLALALPLASSAQQVESDLPIWQQARCELTLTHIPVGDANDPMAVTRYLEQNIAHVASKSSLLQLEDSRSSLTGHHYTYKQFINNVPVYNGQVKANTDNNGNIRSILNNSYDPASTQSAAFPTTADLQSRLDQLNLSFEKLDRHPVWFPVENELVPAQRAEYTTPAGSFAELIVGPNGEVLLQNDLLMYHSQHLMPDTGARALVFMPDPLSTSGNVYGSPWVDNNDQDLAILNDERVEVSMRVEYDNGTYKLESPYVIISEHSNPSVAPATRTDSLFFYTRSQDEFEDVNVFYHLSAYQNYMQSLGFNLVNYQIKADAHGAGGADQSFFSSSDLELTFGDGGVDDGEDADVIIHEYGHAIAHSAAPNSNSGSQRQALDEATGDYLAASYSRSLVSGFGWEKVFTWDGHNEFWGGRWAVSTKQYPGDLIGSIYADAEIWAATIMQIQEDIGQEEADKILLESLHGYATQMSMTAAAELYLQADSMLYAGIHTQEICNRFTARGLLNSCVVGIEENILRPATLHNSENFTYRGQPAWIQFEQPVKADVIVSDVQGRVLGNQRIVNATQFLLQPTELPEGVLLITVRGEVGDQTFRLINLGEASR